MYGKFDRKLAWSFKIQITNLLATTVYDDVAFGLENIGLANGSR